MTTKFLKFATLVLAIVSTSACMKSNNLGPNGQSGGGNVDPHAKTVYNGSVGVATGNQLYSSMMATSGVTSSTAIITERDKVIPSLPGTGDASNMTDGNVYGPMILAALIADAWYVKDTATAVKAAGVFSDLPAAPANFTPSIAQLVFAKLCVRSYGQSPTPAMLSAIDAMYSSFFVNPTTNAPIAPTAQTQRDFVNAMITSIFVSPAFVARI